MPSTRATPRVGNLPVELTSFVGRRQGLTDLKRALASSRLLTLTGAGGVGKTKLAVRAGRESTRQYPDGVWFVELAPIQDPDLVPQAVYTALGLQDHATVRALPNLSAYLADKRLLLILDNCEHVHDAAALLAGTLLRACPDLRILATSRQALGVTGEVVIDVPTLSLPQVGETSPEALGRSDAVALFVERANAVQPGFALDAANAAAILRICAHVDGIPLALELAAVRLRDLGLDGLDRGLGGRLEALGVGDRSLSPRQQTLEGAIQWSYHLLIEQERRLWARLSVFAGGFDLDAAAAVCSGDGIASNDVPGIVGRLVEQSMVKRQRSDAGDRFRLLEPLRQFCRDRLRETDEETAFQRRHRDWVAALAAAAGTSNERQVAAFDRISIERANLWAALEFCLRDSAEAAVGAAICRDLWIYWVSQGPATDARRVVSALLAITPFAGRPRGTLLWVSALLESQRGDSPAAEHIAAEALEIGRSIGDADVVAWALQALGVAAYLDGRHEAAISYANESLALAGSMGFRFTALSAMVMLGSSNAQFDRLTETIAVTQDAIALSEQLGETWERASLFRTMAVLSLRMGAPAEAEDYARRSLQLKRDLGDLIGLASGLEALASIAVARGSGARAATLLGGAEAIWLSIPAPRLEPLRADHDRAVIDAREAIGPTAFEAAYAAGRDMTRDEVVDHALDDGRPTIRQAVAAQVPDSPLSRREMEVAGLVAEGATNAQVAARLFISERTVESHMASIFNKLGLDTRLQVARWFASSQVAAPI